MVDKDEYTLRESLGAHLVEIVKQKKYVTYDKTGEQYLEPISAAHLNVALGFLRQFPPMDLPTTDSETSRELEGVLPFKTGT